MSILQFDNVSKIFYTKEHRTVALDRLSFEINEGEFVALIGPSGCGKTTILSLVCGLIEPTSGRIIRGQSGTQAKKTLPLDKGNDGTRDTAIDQTDEAVNKGGGGVSAESHEEQVSKEPPLDGKSEGIRYVLPVERTEEAINQGVSGVPQKTICNERSEVKPFSAECSDTPKLKSKLFAKSKENGETPSVGYMLQRDQLFEWRTIEKNVVLGLEIQGKKTAENVEKARDLLKKYGLWEFRKHYPQQLSGGMRQRVALIRTLATNPDLLLLDEPFSALDFQTRLDVCDDVYDIIKKENKTALLVTHDISEAIALADKIIVLTARPATVKDVHYTKMEDIDTPLHRRQSPDFSRQFEYLHNLLHNI